MILFFGKNGKFGYKEMTHTSNFCSISSPLLASCCLGSSQGTEEKSLLGDEGLGHEEAGGNGGATGSSENKASGEVKPDNPGPGDSQTRPCGLGRGGGEAAQHQAGEGHSDQALETRGAMSNQLCATYNGMRIISGKAQF